ncbi:MAG TPA: divergent polysaccharide deacetylase family protein [Afifellaceae bacterium]|nr:divergent polysaccharide deacetylase family protein [Afifellaceae bacterium]
MATNDLNAPLRPKRRSKRRPFRLFLVPIMAISALSVAVFASVWVAAVDDPQGGQPVAYARIEGAEKLATGSLDSDGAGMRDSEPAGEKQIELSAKPQPPNKIRDTATPIADLVEQSSFGPLPKVGKGGLRPLDAYARPARVGPYGGKPRIVIIVGGMGISQTSTQRAIDNLPPDVTLAFAPYGGSLDRWTARARKAGHEVLLQVPMEPFGYPEAKPGPHTLLTSAKAKKNADSLKWALSRMTSYTGVMNYMGARYLSDAAAVKPFLSELTNRGLMFIDDGTSNGSQSDAVGAQVGANVATADIVVDRVRSRRQIAQALEQLEKKARADGIAIGVASAFRTSIDEISRWIIDAEKRGFAIVPASAALAKRT